MANGAEFTEFAIRFSREAVALRRQFPPELQVPVQEVIDRLTDEPRSFPDRIRPISRDGQTLLYRHPEPPFEITYEIDEDEKVVYFVHFANPVIVELRRNLFVSYAHEDREWLDEIRKWLTDLEGEGVLTAWDDTEIQAGDRWRQEIEKHLKSAKLALLLVSQDFLHSDFIQNDELPHLLEAAEHGGLRILWIPVRDSLVEGTPIAEYQALHPTDEPLANLSKGERDTALKKIYRKIKEAVAA